ncbi:hypothetical protein CRYUN_Cryun33cG0023000 [Craigia yunnanensis]
MGSYSILNDTRKTADHGINFIICYYNNAPIRRCLMLLLFDSLKQMQVISKDIFAFMSIFIILVASIGPILVKSLYDPSRKYVCYQIRSIMHSKFDEELRMIGCIHVPGNVNSIINILNASCPTREIPIALDVLHLVKLSGRATPVFIAHQKHMKTLSNKSYSENVVLAFNQFERDNWGAVTVNVFTPVYPPNLMYDDICNLAMDQLTSFIVPPFHRRWYIDGSIESEDPTIRSLTCSILERAPCSHCCDLLGGKNDREALALAKRISHDKSVSLTVIHLRAANSLGAILAETDRMLDDEMLRDIKESLYMRYVEKRYNSEDPQTLGLQEWSEFQELGIIGDLLSTADFAVNYSLLIVQQQQQKTA